jgi:hypothetical protein
MRLGRAHFASLCSRWAILALGVASFAAPAAQILKISPSRKLFAIGDVATSPWHTNDAACVERDAANRVCGQVIKVMSRGLIFSASTANHDFSAGETVTLRKPGGSRRLASTSESYAEAPSRGSSGISNDLVIGANLLQPYLRYEHSLGRHFSIGLMPIYLDYSASAGTLSGFGGYATLSYYFSQAFRGFWIMGGVGYYEFTATLSSTSETGSTPGVLGGLGYRWLLRSGLNVSLGIGAQYLANPQTPSLQFTSLFPAAMLDLGYAF